MGRRPGLRNTCLVKEIRDNGLRSWPFWRAALYHAVDRWRSVNNLVDQAACCQITLEAEILPLLTEYGALGTISLDSLPQLSVEAERIARNFEGVIPLYKERAEDLGLQSRDELFEMPVWAIFVDYFISFLLTGALISLVLWYFLGPWSVLVSIIATLPFKIFGLCASLNARKYYLRRRRRSLVLLRRMIKDLPAKILDDVQYLDCCFELIKDRRASA